MTALKIGESCFTSLIYPQRTKTISSHAGVPVRITTIKISPPPPPLLPDQADTTGYSAERIMNNEQLQQLPRTRGARHPEVVNRLVFLSCYYYLEIRTLQPVNTSCFPFFCSKFLREQWALNHASTESTQPFWQFGLRERNAGEVGHALFHSWRPVAVRASQKVLRSFALSSYIESLTRYSTVRSVADFTSQPAPSFFSNMINDGLNRTGSPLATSSLPSKPSCELQFGYRRHDYNFMR